VGRYDRGSLFFAVLRILRIHTVLILIGLCCAQMSLAQTDSVDHKLPHKLDADSTTVEKPETRSPRVAAIMSAAVPGLGQIYNKKYWKLPLVYGALGTAGYFYVANRVQWLDYKTAYLNDLDEENPPSSYALEGATTDQLRSAADKSRGYMEYSVIAFGIVYALQIVDATVDAHLFHFDVSDDLSLRVQPELMNNPYRAKPVQGIGLNLTF